jgi:serine/threonine protein kinase
MRAVIGARLAHYEITRRLGSGGMGDVYQATDHRLGRNVAIRILPEAFAQDTDRRTRFGREARVLASLNHSHIAAIYGFEESGGQSFFVMNSSRARRWPNAFYVVRSPWRRRWSRRDRLQKVWRPMVSSPTVSGSAVASSTAYTRRAQSPCKVEFRSGTSEKKCADVAGVMKETRGELFAIRAGAGQVKPPRVASPSLSCA